MARLDLLKGVCGSSARKCVTNERPEVLVAFGPAKDRPNLPLGARVRLLRTWAYCYSSDSEVRPDNVWKSPNGCPD